MNTDLLIIYIRNSRDIYALTEWLQNALLKKVNRGLTPSVEYLANCSTMKRSFGWLQKCFPIRIIRPQPSKKKNKRQENTRPILSDAWNIFLNSNNNYFSGVVMAPGYFLLFIIHPLKLCIMTTTNRLFYTVSKRYIQAGTTFKINVKILLADDCKNNICDWSITADIYEQRKNGRFVWCAGGCCHEEILKRFPQFKMFVDLHLSNHYGAPMYPVENGFYYITNSSKETAINYLRITETEYNLLHQAEDKQYFKYLLYTLGIVERWKRESNEALKKLEELTGQTWENPYKPENERFTLKLTDEERTTITNRINDGYYRPEAVQARKDEEKRKAYEKKRAEIINDCKKKQQKAENEKRVMLAVLDAGLSVNNVIYYDHSNELVFNWKDYETKVTENDFNKFVSSVNRSLLPAGITFKMK